jgi:CubicO group peptidase (beta-lactamase class C family)
MPEDIATRSLQAIQGKLFPGCVVGIVWKSGERIVLPFGNFTYDARSPVVEENTVYDLASITKSIPLASLALLMIANGKLKRDTMVRTHVPELKNHYDATVQDLLTYRVQGPQLALLKDKTSDELLAHVFESGFSAPPGESLYTNLPALLLGLIIERVEGTSLDRLAKTELFSPFGMRWTGFFPSQPQLIPPTEVDDWRGEVQGLPHDESAYVFAKEKRAAGHAGLFSSAHDILHFLETLLYGDLRPVTGGAQMGLGWQVSDPRFMGEHARPLTFGKTGFTGTSCVVDMDRGVAFVILSNRTYPKRPQTDAAIYRFRADIADMIFSSL